MRVALRRILDERWIVVLGSAIALGYTLTNLAQAVATTIIIAFERQSGDERALFAFSVRDHVIDVGAVIAWLIAFALVLGVVASAVARMQRPADTP